jgi:hypothetical protein
VIFGISLYTSQGASWVKLLPLPETRSLRCLTIFNNTYYAAGLGGVLLSSQDGLTWLDQSTGYTNAFVAATTGNQLLVLGGYDSLVISSNGLSWQQVTNPASDYPGALGFGNGRFVYLGVAGSIATSTNAFDWETDRPIDGQQQFTGFCYGNGVFVGLGQRGIYSSQNGTSWTQVYTPIANGPTAGVFAKGGFLAGDIDGHLYQSDDGLAWRQSTVSLPSSIQALLFDGTQYIAVLNYGTSFATSIDATNWAPISPPIAANALTGLAANGRLVFSGASGALVSGTSPTELSVINPGLGGDLVDVAAGPSNYVAVTSGVIMVSDDGLTWRQLPGYPSRPMHFIRYSHGRFIAGCDWGVLFTSSNGINWVESSLPTTSALSSFATDGTREVMVGTFGGTFYSDDGVSWQPGSGGWTGGDITYNAVTWANGTWVCAGNGRLVTSTNGSDWQIRPIDTSWFLNGISFAQNKFVAVGNGVILTSPDGAVWTAQSSPGGLQLKAIDFIGTNWVATVGPKVPGPDSSPGVIVSSTGTNWMTNSFSVPPYVGLYGLTHDAQVALAVGSFGYIYRLGEMPQPTLTLKRVDDQLQYTLSGLPRVNLAIEQSDDMQTWSAPLFILNAGATTQFRQLPIPGVPNQFYRASVR